MEMVCDGIETIVAQKLAEVFGQQVIADNHAGASGTIGTMTVFNAPARLYATVGRHGQSPRYQTYLTIVT